MVRIGKLAAALLIAATAALAAPAAAQDGCLSGREGRRILESGSVVPFPVAAQRAGISPRDVQNVTLCQAGGGFVYQVRIVGRSGSRTVTIPAN